MAAWRARPDTVRLLLERGAPQRDATSRGRTPLMLAIKRGVDSYWTERRTPEPSRLLLEAGASMEGIRLPTGYDAVDALLRQRGR